MIELKHISKKYGTKIALDDVSLQFHQGMYGLLGPNGAGKTTLMRIMASVMNAESGEIYVDGQLQNSVGMRKQIGYLPQHFSFYKNLSVEECLQHVAYMKDIEKDKIKQEVTHVIEEVNLSEKSRDLVGTLSGGMLRRLGIAQAILGSPRMLIVDEPTAGLDPEERVRFRNLLSEICENRTVLISTHIVEDIEFICDKVILLDQGTIVREGTYHQIVEEISGKIWEIKSTTQVINNAKFKILSKRKDADGYTYKIVGDRPDHDAKLVNPSLEDAYLYYVGESIQ